LGALVATAKIPRSAIEENIREQISQYIEYTDTYSIDVKVSFGKSPSGTDIGLVDIIINQQAVIGVLGTAATVALTFCPVEGPFGELLTLLATPAFCALVGVAAEIKKKVLISGKRGFEKFFMKAEGGQNPQVSGYSLDNNEAIDDFVQFAENLGEVTKGL
jgi:hypothetical protein